MPTRDSTDERWWLIEDAEERHGEAWAKALELERRSGSERKQKALDCLALYDGTDQNDFGMMSQFFPDLAIPSFNVVQQCVDTRANHIFRNKVRPLFLTEGGDYGLKEKAEGMQRAVEGEFYRVGMYGDLGSHVCWDGEVFEAGGVKIYPDYANKRVNFERIFPWEVLVDERDAKRGTPRVFCHVQKVDRAVLLGKFPDKADILEEASAFTGQSTHMTANVQGDTVSDELLVVEWWHLPSVRVDRKDEEAWSLDAEHDGRHIICVESGTLHEEAWPFDYFPIAWYKPEPRRIGYWSRSAGEALLGTQVAINRMADRIDRILHLHARPLLYVNRNARMNTGHIDNGIASILEGNMPAGTAIQYITPQSVPAEYINQITRLIQWGREQRGISELSASGKKPAGIEAKVALQHLSETEAIRHTKPFRAWESFHLDAARILIDAMRMIARECDGYEVMYSEDKALERIDWTEVDLPEDRYRLKVWPTNLLAQEPSAKTEQALELAKVGILDNNQVKALMDFPDIEGVTGDSTAELRNIQEKLEGIVRGDSPEKTTAHAYLDLKLAWTMGIRRYNQLEADGADDAVLDKVRKWLEDVDQLLKPAMAPPAPPGAPPEGAPPGPGGPPMPPPGPPPPPGGMPQGM